MLSETGGNLTRTETKRLLTVERTEELIIQQLVKGNEKAYRHLYEKHYAVLCHIANQYVKDDFLAETIVNDVIFHLWEVRASIQITTSLRSYLAQSVRHRCLDYLKSQQFQKEMVSGRLGVSRLPVVQYINHDDYPLGKLLEKELEEQIMSAIERLPDKCRKVFRLSRFEGKKDEEIAAELGISINTVKYHIKHALTLLRTDLQKYLLILFLTLIQN